MSRSQPAGASTTTPPSPPAPPWTQPAPGSTATDSGAGGQLPPGAPAPAPENVQPVPEGPWKKLACHRSWLASFRLVQRQAQVRMDPTTGQIDPTSLQGGAEIITVPVVSPYPCLGPACMLWDAQRQTCIERAALAAQADRAELEAKQIRTHHDAKAAIQES